MDRERVMDDEWVAERAGCPECGRRWIAVFPVGTDPLECPECSALVGVAVPDAPR